MKKFNKKNVELIPREVLWGNPDKMSPKISPDGTMISYLAPYNDVLNVWIKTIDKDDASVITKDESSG
ncbi:DPP IV N-terminal domain-containing protein, partial [bacterium]|nr:DPP IV N-terminal domain-containing protein [bacterium]